jgi:hypothetical protein
METVPDSHIDLLDTELATLATVGPDGRPPLSEFLAEDESVRLSLNTSRQEAKNLATDPACTILLPTWSIPTATPRSGETPTWSATTTTSWPVGWAPATASTCADTTPRGRAGWWSQSTPSGSMPSI